MFGTYNLTKKSKVFIMFDDIVADMEPNKRLNAIVTELLLKGKTVNISIIFESQSYFKMVKTIKLNATHYSIMKILSKGSLQEIVSNHFSDI